MWHGFLELRSTALFKNPEKPKQKGGCFGFGGGTSGALSCQLRTHRYLGLWADSEARNTNRREKVTASGRTERKREYWVHSREDRVDPL